MRSVLKWSKWEEYDTCLRGCFPKGKVVLVASQFDGDPLPTLWIEHEQDPNQITNYDTYLVYGTGHAIDSDALEHVGSAICTHGNLVWHVYKKPA